MMSTCACLFGLRSSPTRPTPWQKGCSLSGTKGNCYGVTAPDFIPEHSKPNLREFTHALFYPVTASIRTYPFYRHSGRSVPALSLSLFLFHALPFASIVTIATCGRTPFARHERIWGRCLGKADNRHRRIWGVRRA